MPWTEVDGSIVHYTPTPGSTATEAEVQDEIRRCMNEAAVEKIARLKHMPTEQDALRTMFAAYQRLKELGWNDAIYCPKDGSSFDVIEPGSTGIHRAHYSGDWPKGSWWVEDAGDLWPSRPILYRVTEAEKAKWTAVRKGLAEAANQAESGASGTDGQGPLSVARSARDEPIPPPNPVSHEGEA